MTSTFDTESSLSEALLPSSSVASVPSVPSVPSVLAERDVSLVITKEEVIVDESRTNHNENYHDDDNDDMDGNHHSWSRGEVQDSTCRDGVWVILFLIQYTVVMSLAIAWGIEPLFAQQQQQQQLQLQQLEETSLDSNTRSQIMGFLNGWAILFLWIALTAILIASLALWVMTHFAAILIQTSILFNIGMSLVFTIISLWHGIWIAAGMGIVMVLVGVLYAISIWSTIPWAASNLMTAVTAIRTNVGITFIGGLTIVGSILTTLIYALAIMGTYTHMISCTTPSLTLTDTTDAISQAEICESHMNGFIVILFLVSYYWTMQVIKNILHVTVAGVVGTWWFTPEDANACCSPSILESFARSCTTSLGSICLGSLLVAIITTLHGICQYYARSTNHRGRGATASGIIYCLLECLLSILQSLMEYCNKWGFVYIGLYGYSYWEAGPKVMNLFRERGWSAILNDQLVYRLLNWMSLVMGTLTGLGAMIIVSLYPTLLSSSEDNNNNNHATMTFAFLFGLAVGTVIANILLDILKSAVNTIVVCFAEAPLEFRHAYPHLNRIMDEAWRQTFPTEYRNMMIPNSTLV